MNNPTSPTANDNDNKNESINLKRALETSASEMTPKKKRKMLMLPNDCGPLPTDNLFADNNPFNSDDKKFVSVCKQKHKHLQHIMRNMEEKHNDEGDLHNTLVCHDPKIKEFCLHCKHFFRQNPDTKCQVTPMKVQSHMACQFFCKKKSLQGRKKVGACKGIQLDCAKAAAVAKTFNEAELCSNGQVSERTKKMFLKLCSKNGMCHTHMNQTGRERQSESM